MKIDDRERICMLQSSLSTIMTAIYSHIFRKEAFALSQQAKKVP
jgi:hypothetical protein